MTMTKTDIAVAVYDLHTQAETAVKALQRAGFDMKKISIIGKDYETEEHVVGFKPIALAMLVATVQLTGVAYAQAAQAPAVPVVQPTAQSAPAATKAPIAIKAPEDWIIYDNITYTPVVDNVSEHLDAARKALDTKDDKKAAAELRAVADDLKQQAAHAGKADQALVKADKALVAEDTKVARDTMKRLNASALKVSSAATAIESGKIKTEADLDKAIDKAARADMERRWLVTDVTTWYPVSEEPQRHFTDAVAAYAKKDYKAAATDIRKATSYLRLEADRATGGAKQELDRLGCATRHARRLGRERCGEGRAIDDQGCLREPTTHSPWSTVPRRPNRGRARSTTRPGYELKAAAHGLESAAGWARSGKRRPARQRRWRTPERWATSSPLGATWTRDEITKGFESLGNGINALGQKIGSTKKASPFNADA